MKKVFILLIFSFLTCFVTFAQNSNDGTVTLTVEQYNALPTNVKKSIEKENTYRTIGKWAGLGKEIGEGVNSALMAIEGSATRISETTLGKTAMYVVVWKFVGKDIIRITIGILVLAIGVPIMINLINSYKPHKTLIKKHFIKEKMQFEKEYRYESGNGDCVTFCYGGLLIIIAVACLIMFV